MQKREILPSSLHFQISRKKNYEEIFSRNVQQNCQWAYNMMLVVEVHLRTSIMYLWLFQIRPFRPKNSWPGFQKPAGLQHDTE